jgi:hypothetical protein
VWAWIFTIPASGILAGLAALVLRSGSLTVVLAIVVLVASFIWLARWWTRSEQPGTDVGA